MAGRPRDNFFRTNFFSTLFSGLIPPAPPSRCSKDVTEHPQRPGARPDRPCPVPACSGQPLPGKRRFSFPLQNRIFEHSSWDLLGKLACIMKPNSFILCLSFFRHERTPYLQIIFPDLSVTVFVTLYAGAK
jgi:hypothetical protein